MTPLDQARRAVARYAALDPAGWQTGLSADGARVALATAACQVLRGLASHESPTPPAPRSTLVWCAGNVFTAPLEWTALFTAAGHAVTLKAPGRVPAPVHALAAAFRAEGLPVAAWEGPREAAWGLVPAAQGVLAFGPDGALEDLDARLPPGLPRSLHGHRVSASVLSGHPDRAIDLARDLTLYDTRGCMSPVVTFVLGDVDPLAAALHAHLHRWPWDRGPLTPLEGTEWRRRLALGRMLGRTWEGHQHAVLALPATELEPAGLPWLAPLVPVHDLDEVRALVTDWPLSTVGTDLDPAALAGLAPRVCRTGTMQAPALHRLHDGVDVPGRLGAC